MLQFTVFPPAGQTGNMLLLLIAFGAVMNDLKTGRIPNAWLLTGLALAAACRFVSADPRSIISDSLPGMLIPLLILFPLFFFRMLGAGDIKLFCVLGFLLGKSRIFPCLFLSFLFGAVLSVILMTAAGILRERVRYLISYILLFLSTGKKIPYRREGRRPENFHFTVPILMSVFLAAGGFY